MLANFKLVIDLRFIAAIYKIFIVVVIVLFFKRGKLVKPFDEQPFAFKVGKAERSHNLFRVFALCPVFNRFKKFFSDFGVVYTIKTRKSRPFLPPLFIGGFLPGLKEYFT